MVRASAIYQHLADNAALDCTLYTLGGAQVAHFQCTKADVPRKARRQGLPAGTYVLRFGTGTARGAQKIVVK